MTGLFGARRLAAVTFAGFAFLPGCAAPDPRRPDDPRWPEEDIAWRGRQTNILVGLRSFEDDRWEPVEDQVLIALDYCEPMGLDAVRLEGGIHYSWDEASATLPGGAGVELHAETLELSAGLNASYPVGRLRPYLGAGAALLFADVKDLDQGAISRDNDVTPGGYAKVGLLFQVSRIAHVGVEVRGFASNTLSLGGAEIDGDSGQFALVFGTSF